jgi:hypothetical protein
MPQLVLPEFEYVCIQMCYFCDLFSELFRVHVVVKDYVDLLRNARMTPLGTPCRHSQTCSDLISLPVDIHVGHIPQLTDLIQIGARAVIQICVLRNMPLESKAHTLQLFQL